MRFYPIYYRTRTLCLNSWIRHGVVWVGIFRPHEPTRAVEISRSALSGLAYFCFFCPAQVTVDASFWLSSAALLRPLIFFRWLQEPIYEKIWSPVVFGCLRRFLLLVFSCSRLLISPLFFLFHGCVLSCVSVSFSLLSASASSAAQGILFRRPFPCLRFAFVVPCYCVFGVVFYELNMHFWINAFN